MLKFVSFFCALFVSEAIGAALNVSAVDSNTDVSRTELVQNITAAFRRLDTTYRRGYAGLPIDNIGAQIRIVTPKLYDNLTLIHKRINESNAEYFEDRELAESCDSLFEMIRRYHHIAQSAHANIREYQWWASYLKYLVNTTYNKTSQELNRLNSSASSCEQNECNEIKKQLSDLDIDGKLQEMSSQFDYIRDKLKSAQRHIRNGFKSDMTRYESMVNATYRDFKNCLNCTKNRIRNLPEDKKEVCIEY